MQDNQYEHIFATLILRGSGLNPQEVTRLLELSPSRSFKRGDRRNEKDQWKHNFWSFSSKNQIQSPNLAAHLEWLLNQLAPNKTRLLEILATPGIEAEISCFWIFPSEHSYLSISPELVQRIAGLGLGLKIECYCP